MPFQLEDLRSAASGFRKYATEELTESRARERYLKTVFLCHSHKDQEYVRGFITRIRDNGWTVYVDWLDSTMPEKPNRETADRLQARIRRMDYFVYLATPNSSSSRWCPWEIGYADGVKNRDQIMLVTTTDYSGHLYGAEYLELYQQIDIASSGSVAVFDPHSTQGTRLSSF
jgi:hypothetical protein